MSRSEPISLVTAADDRYALPLAAMLRSAGETLALPYRLAVCVLDGGVAPASRQRVEGSLEGLPVEVEWVSPPEGVLDHLMLSHHVSRATYLRLLAPQLLPHVGKAIYLDPDLVVRTSLGELWEQELGEDALLAVQDSGAPTVGSPGGLRLYRELGLSPDLEFFNAGVLVFDLERWRREQIGPRVLDYLTRHAEHVQWHDQDGLNAILAGSWRPLDPRWNQLPHLFGCESWSQSPFSREAFEAVLSEPHIVHYATSSKPWHWACRHPWRELFFEVLDRTRWAGWRPRRSWRDTPVGHLTARARKALRRLAS